MKRPEDIKVLNVDNVPYAVDALSSEVQGLVEIYNLWQQEEHDAKLVVMQKGAAKETVSRQIIQTIRDDATKLAEADTTEVDAETTSDTTAGDTTTQPEG